MCLRKTRNSVQICFGSVIQSLYKFDREGALVELGRFERILQVVNDTA